jgi:alpha-ketoglutarate-dependent taurine dioxygenase
MNSLAQVGMKSEVPVEATRHLREDGFWATTADDETDFLRLAGWLGTAVPTRPGEPLIQKLTPTTHSGAHRRSLSAIYGVGEFPFHTDAAHHRRPPHWMLMRCVDAGPVGRPTLFADVRALRLSPRQRRAIKRAVWWVRSGGRAFLASVLSVSSDGERVRYDRGCMMPADPAFAPAASVFEEVLGSTTPMSVAWRAGDVVVIDNWRLLHARADGDGSDAGKRLLQRILVR